MTPQPDPVTPPATCPVCGSPTVKTGQWWITFSCGYTWDEKRRYGPCPQAHDVALALRQRVQALEAALRPFAAWPVYECDNDATPVAVRGTSGRIYTSDVRRAAALLARLTTEAPKP